MKEKLSNAIHKSKTFVSKHSPEILTGIGVTGMVGATILAVKATPKALSLIEDEITNRNMELSKEAIQNGWDIRNQITHLKPLEVVKVAWKPYLPSGILMIVSASCIVGASTINSKRNAALATAYAISERALVRYKDKVIETIGEKKEKEIRDKIAQDEVNKRPISSSQVIVTSKGNTLCMDAISGRTFRSDIDAIKKAVNKLNRDMTYYHYISLDDFYSEIGLESIKNGSRLGWNLDDGLIDLDFSACLTEDDEPCIYIDYSISPKYDFDKLA